MGRCQVNETADLRRFLSRQPQKRLSGRPAITAVDKRTHPSKYVPLPPLITRLPGEDESSPQKQRTGSIPSGTGCSGGGRRRRPPPAGLVIVQELGGVCTKAYLGTSTLACDVAGTIPRRPSARE